MNEEPLPIFVGAAANHEDLESQAVLEWSLRKHTSRPLEITWMRLSRDPASPFYSNPETGEGWDHSLWSTPFSGFRWAVPELAGFEGRALYTDSDVIFMADVADLFEEEIGDDKLVVSKPDRFCVSLWRCDAFKAGVDKTQPTMHLASQTGFSQFGQAGVGVQPFGTRDWHVLDGEGHDDLLGERVGAIHYSHLPTQPHLPRAIERLGREGRRHWIARERVKPHPRADLVELFEALLEEAKANGFGVERYADCPRFGRYAGRLSR